MYRRKNFGKSIEDAIPIYSRNSWIAVKEENWVLSNMFGETNPEWQIEGQFLISKDGRSFDLIRVRTRDGVVDVYFDVSKPIMNPVDDRSVNNDRS